jgi:hypothetical protein
LHLLRTHLTFYQHSINIQVPIYVSQHQLQTEQMNFRHAKTLRRHGLLNCIPGTTRNMTATRNTDSTTGSSAKFDDLQILQISREVQHSTRRAVLRCGRYTARAAPCRGVTASHLNSWRMKRFELHVGRWTAAQRDGNIPWWRPKKFSVRPVTNAVPLAGNSKDISVLSLLPLHYTLHNFRCGPSRDFVSWRGACFPGQMHYCASLLASIVYNECNTQRRGWGRNIAAAAYD